jgi:4-hydroxy-tetrahydrodipicolinate synthase
MQMDFGRLITAMVTPFDPHHQVNINQIKPLIDYLIEVQKSDSLVICGTTGESPTLSDDEKMLVIQKSIQAANHRCKIIAGTGSFDTSHTIELSKKVEQLGVDALLIVAPYYSRPSQEGIYQHYKSIAESVNLPVIIYNVPTRTSVNIDPETTIRLSHVPNIVATKDCTSIDQLTKIIKHAAPGFKVYSGDDSMALPAMSIGCHGLISVASHIEGSKIKKMITHFLNGENAEAAALHQELYALFVGLFKYPSPAPVKHLLNGKGVQVGGVRLPLIPLNEDEARWIESMIQK